MAAVKLTKTYVEKLPYTEKGQQYYQDAELKGFGVAVAMQSKTYFAQRDIFGKTVRVTIGKHGVFTTEEAREEARQLLARMAKGENPNTTKKELLQKRLTFAEALEQYRKGRKQLSQTIHYRLDCLKTMYLPDWQLVQLHEISKEMVFKRHLKIGEKHGKTQANTVFQLVRAIYNFAMQGHDHLPPNPVTALSSAKAWYKETRRRSVIKPHQIKPWYDTVMLLDNSTIRDYLRLLLFTGMRRIEAMELRWENVDFAERMLTVPHTKNTEPLDLPLSDYVFALLQERTKRTGKSPFVFPGDGKTGHLVEPKNSVKKIAEDSGVPFMLHDLRRTFTTIAESLDIPAYAIKGLINHKSGSDITASYIIMTPDRLREPMQKVTNRILELAAVG
jgi:integrase